MKLGHVIDYNKINIFPQKSCRKWGRKNSSGPFFCFLEKALYDVKASGLQLSFYIFR